MDSNSRQNLPDLESEHIPNEYKHQSKQAIRLSENAFHLIPDLLIEPNRQLFRARFLLEFVDE
jgi:hypothetical protein